MLVIYAALGCVSYPSHCKVDGTLKLSLGLDDDEVKKMVHASWDSMPNKRVVMSTTALGHGSSSLGMCIKESGMRKTLSLTLDDGEGI